MTPHSTTSGNYFVRWKDGEIENNLRSLAEAARVAAKDYDGYVGRVWEVVQGRAVFVGNGDELSDE